MKPVLLLTIVSLLVSSVIRYLVALLVSLDLTTEMILDTGFWILDKNLKKS